MDKEDVMKEIFDIVEKNDKIYVILKEEMEKQNEEIKNMINNLINMNVEDIEVIDLFDAFQKKIFKELSDAISLLDNQCLPSKFGLKTYTEVFYDLSNLSQSKKMLFNYALFGRRGNTGFLQSMGGTRLTTSSFIVPVEKEKEVEDFINSWGVKYTKREVLKFVV